jgi:hypothetical protein
MQTLEALSESSDDVDTQRHHAIPAELAQLDQGLTSRTDAAEKGDGDGDEGTRRQGNGILAVNTDVITADNKYGTILRVHAPADTADQVRALTVLGDAHDASTCTPFAITHVRHFHAI